MTNGGLASAASGDPNRPPGKLLILDRFNGAILYQDTIPDGSETYFSPMIWPLSESFGGDLIVLGSGGETLPGALWTLSLTEFQQNGFSEAVKLLQDDEKGFIQTPAFADLNSDGAFDMLVPRINNGGLIALDGLTKKTIWSFELPNTENYVSPIIGDFTGDGLPDVFCIFARGTFPIYFNYLAHLIDGKTGLSLYSESLPLNQFNAGNALDWDMDGVDELLLVQNKNAGPLGLTHAFRILDFNNDTSYYITEFMPGSTAFSTPLIRDIDQDGLLEIIYVFDPRPSPSAEIEATAFGRFDLNIPSGNVAWAGFLGNFEDGTYRENLNDSSKTGLNFTLNVFPNPASDKLRIIDQSESIESIQMIDFLGKKCDIDFEKFGKNYLVNTNRLAHGMYILRVSDGKRQIVQKVLIER